MLILWVKLTLLSVVFGCKNVGVSSDFVHHGMYFLSHYKVSKDNMEKVRPKLSRKPPNAITAHRSET